MQNGLRCSKKEEDLMYKMINIVVIFNDLKLLLEKRKMNEIERITSICAIHTQRTWKMQYE